LRHEEIPGATEEAEKQSGAHPFGMEGNNNTQIVNIDQRRNFTYNTIVASDPPEVRRGRHTAGGKTGEDVMPRGPKRTPSSYSIANIIREGTVLEGTFYEGDGNTCSMIMEIERVKGARFRGSISWSDLNESRTTCIGTIHPDDDSVHFTETEQTCGEGIVLHGRFDAVRTGRGVEGTWKSPETDPGSSAYDGTFAMTVSAEADRPQEEAESRH
jgi:hypothetical protein